jgi:K+/H+ antiporter YhaU regulatory subunit KhtT
VAGQTLGASNVRARTGASIVAIGRKEGVVTNPGPTEVLRPEDRVAVLGNRVEIEGAARMLAGLADVPERQSLQA